MRRRPEVARYFEYVGLALAETGDIDLALDAADAALKLPEQTLRLALDLYNPRSQDILNRALRASKDLTQKAQRELKEILGLDSHAEAARRLVAFIRTYRDDLSQLLSETQLAAFLEGAREVARYVPVIPPAGVAGTMPPDLSPFDVNLLVERLAPLETAAREAEIYLLPSSQQNYVRNLVEAQVASNPPEPLLLDQGEGEQWPVIDEAVKELSGKNVVTREVFDQLDAAARQKAFTVAGVESEETLGKIRDVLAEQVETGGDRETFRQEVLQTVGAGTFLSENHLETVFRANIQGALSDGQMRVLSHPFIRGGFPYAAYHAIHDDRVRDTHLALETLGIAGTNVYRLDDPVFQTFRPPWDFGDRCGWTPMTIRQAAEKGVPEAQSWLESGVEPFPPAHVSMPPFRPSPTFQRALTTELSIRLSFTSLEDYLPIPLGMVGDEWHGPKPPGEGWTLIGKGPRGGKRWKRGVQAPHGPEPIAQIGTKKGYEKDPWVAHVGSRGKTKGMKGWKNTQTGRIVFGEKPGHREAAKLNPQTAQQSIQAALANPNLSVGEAQKLMESLLSMSVRDLQQLKKGLGIKASGPKTELARKILERAAGVKPKEEPPTKETPPETGSDTTTIVPPKTAPIAQPSQDAHLPIQDRINGKAGEGARQKVAQIAAWKEEFEKRRDVIFWQSHKLSNEALDIAVDLHHLRKRAEKAKTERGRRPYEEAKAKHDALRKQIEELEKERSATFDPPKQRLKELLTIGNATPVVASHFDPGHTQDQKEAFNSATDWLGGIVAVGKDGGLLPDFIVIRDDATTTGRSEASAYYYAQHNFCNVPSHYNEAPDTYMGQVRVAINVHEMSHGIEYKMAGAQKAANDFLNYRVGSEPLQKLKDLPGGAGAGYGDWEYGRKDDFEKAFGDSAWYVGKEVNHHAHGDGTEVVSMGVQKLYEDPITFATKDPEYCAFIIGILDGSLRS
jgi:hypothetical protein